MKRRFINLFDQKNYNFSVVSLLLLVVFISMLSSSCESNKKLPAFNSKDQAKVIAMMTNIMLQDITNPPLAARFFSYTCLAGYEVVSEYDPAFKSMYGKLNKYPKIEKPAPAEPYSNQLSTLLAMMETAKKMQPSGPLMDSFEVAFLDSCKKIGYDEEIITNSKNYAIAVSKQILAYAKADGYNKISNLPRYTARTEDGFWYPTPPAFMGAVEPYFRTVRPFTLDTSSQFKPIPPTTFDVNKGSSFYALAEAVYKEKNNLSDQHRLIAGFWDCNPFAVQNEGHLQYGLKKISPGAHWMGITGIACAKANKSFEESMQIYTCVSIGLMDAFICCWDEKYRSNRIRPETAIRKLIDPAWEPLLQTPPFPEYLSGHSVISSASSVILTHYFGDNFNYTDNVEVSYGLSPRSFHSFKEAAQEAAISRFYGGIHFTDAIYNGLQQGTLTGEWVLKTISK